MRWVSESLWPFSIAKDHGFCCLMKTGWPECYIPHLTTISQDVKTVFAKSHNCIAKMLQVCKSLTMLIETDF